ncbi:MAG: hypothetical protein AAB592_02810 [Patescibacteria group bacterium]
MASTKKLAKTFRRSNKDFSDFFHNASVDEKITVFREAAQNANKDQRDLVKQANLVFKRA